MCDFLSIIRKADFIDLFKYGHFNISHAVKFSGNINDYIDDDCLFEQLTSRMNMYEYSFEYLIIHFVSKFEYSNQVSIDIKNVKGIFAFDDEAKREMSISFDSRIQINVSPWADKFSKLYQKHLVAQSMRGVDNIWTIFDLPQEDIAKCKDVISDDIVDDAFRLVCFNEKASGELPIWVYLLRYERHSLYPRDMRGFFCDFVHVVCNWKIKKTIIEDAAEQTEIYSQIIHSADKKFQSLVNVVNNSNIALITQSLTNCKFAIVAPLFLFLKAEFIEGMNNKLKEKYIEYIKSFQLEGSLALYLLGLTLGYDKTYEALYECGNFSFFKKSAEPSKIAKISEPDLRPIPEPKLPETLFPEENEYLKSPPYEWMRKGKGEKARIRPAMTNEECSSLSAEGYEPIKKFTKYVVEAIKSFGYDPKEEEERFSKSKPRRK